MAYRTTLAVIEGEIREDVKGETTIRGGATYLLIGERISWSDERSKQDGCISVESRGWENAYPKWKTLQTVTTDPGSFLSSETRKNASLIDEISN